MRRTRTVRIASVAAPASRALAVPTQWAFDALRICCLCRCATKVHHGPFVVLFYWSGDGAGRYRTCTPAAIRCMQTLLTSGHKRKGCPFLMGLFYLIGATGPHQFHYTSCTQRITRWWHNLLAVMHLTVEIKQLAVSIQKFYAIMYAVLQGMASTIFPDMVVGILTSFFICLEAYKKWLSHFFLSPPSNFSARSA